jgi:hypothetical protein
MSRLSFEEFYKRIQQSSSELLKELEIQLIKSSLRMERDAKLNATTYPKVRTGRLRSSIAGLVDNKFGTPRVILKAGGNVNGAEVNYARELEFGNSSRGIKPRLYLGRAVAGERDRLSDRLSDLLDVALGNN